MDTASGSSRAFGISTRSLLLVGAAVAAGFGFSKLLRRAKITAGPGLVEEKKHDKVLKDTFPASDPPSSQYFDIPVNRQ